MQDTGIGKNNIYVTIYIYIYIFCGAQQPPVGQGLLIHESSRSHKLRTTFGRTPLDEGSARRRDLCLTKHSTHKRQTSMPSVGFKPTIPASERPQTYASERAATGIGKYIYIYPFKTVRIHSSRNVRVSRTCLRIRVRFFTRQTW